MKYVAVCVLSAFTMFSASASTSSPSLVSPPALLAAAPVIPSILPSEFSDTALASMLASALVVLQLRRRQKSMRSARMVSLVT